MTRRHLFAALLAAVFGLAVRADAHPLAPALLDLRETADGLVAVTWKVAQLVIPGAPPVRPRLPSSCVDDTAPDQTVAQGIVTTRWTIRCPGGLVGLVLAVDDLGPARTQALLRVALADGRVVQHVVRPDTPTFVVPERPDRFGVLRDYARLGVEHIASGVDHLLFVFGLLLLVPEVRPLVRTITAFTLGHSLTLALTVLGVLAVPSRVAELAIAGTVLILAGELAAGPGHRSLLRRLPWLMAMAFGLLHGLGFAGALREIGLPDGEIPLALFAFNVGIELGQLVFVAALLVAASLLARLGRAPAWLRLVPVYVMGSTAAFWCFERTAALFH